MQIGRHECVHRLVVVPDDQFGQHSTEKEDGDQVAYEERWYVIVPDTAEGDEQERQNEGDAAVD